ncbi:PucR family transcriptional regulator [Oceanobacillus piezotolerans]|uniref:PucR family transcriptional regulator n=1 Tax=Oceanobacillus piezotolerans TaxID=2448030 RepID=A0A498DEB3_9BACI|nr:helix-turn-helix domain-containing protein [Oceanobacillus piezotolerans]RLL47000.1 PucR family transcriptional regulator [Oceanobacillus piezotolerans]
MKKVSKQSQLSIDILKVIESPEDLADRIAEILDCPITIEDCNHQLISYSSHKENIDEARISTIIRREVPDKVINGLWKSGVMNKLLESDEPVVIPAIDEIGLGNRIAISVRNNNEILGFIWAHANDKEINEDGLRVLKEAAKIVKKQILNSRTIKRKSEANYHNFFWQLLLGELTDKNEITRQGKQFGMELNGELAIVIFEFGTDYFETLKKHAYYLVETSNGIKIVCRLFDQNQFILLVKSNKSMDIKEQLNDFIKKFIEKISSRVELATIKAACGAIYQSAESISDSYRQALKVLYLQEEFPEDLEGVYLYQELGIFQLIEELRDIRQNSSYKNEFIEKLRVYDETKQAELLQTLKVFLECDSNVHLAAQKMFIHTNTMNYRLKRITEVSGLDLKNTNLKVNAYLDLLIENMN